MKALGHFWQSRYDDALAAAKVVGEGKSKDRDLARYIVGQIYHAEGKPGEAIEWYRRVAKLYPDAKEAIDYFEEKRIGLEEVTIVRPGKPVELELDYRNVREAALQVYRVDLMKLYLREKNLSTITKVRLAGIEPELEKTVALGDGRDYVDKERTV
jgi:tetratricopeptide (TPR) repeat protein